MRGLCVDVMCAFCLFIILQPVTSYAQQKPILPVTPVSVEPSIAPREMPSLVPVDIKPIPSSRANNFSLKSANRHVFKTIYNIRQADEQETVRAAWEEYFHINVWAPYYKAKEIEDRICEKASVTVFKMKGKPELDSNNVMYIFKVKF